MLTAHFFANDDYVALLQKLATRTANKINDTGGIAGLKLKIKVFSFEELGITHSSDLESDCKKMCIHLDENPADMIISAHVIRVLSRYAPKQILEGKSLFVGEMDPANRLNAPNTIDLNRELLDNRQSLGFVGTNLDIKNVLFLQVSYFNNEAALKKYENALTTSGYTGDISFLSFSSEEESTLIEKNEDGSEDYIKEFLDKNLAPHLEDLPNNSLVALNTPLEDIVIPYIKNNCANKNIKLFSTGYTDSANLFWVGDINFSMDHINRVEAFMKNESLSNSDKKKSEISVFMLDLDFLYCCQFALKNKLIDVPTTESLLKALPQELNKIDGHQNVFLRSGNIFTFENNSLTSKTSTVVCNTYISELDRCEPIHFERQPTALGTINDVVYSYIDLIRVESIDVSEGVWIGLFELEVNSVLEDPIKHIRFANKSTVNDLWDVLEIRQTKDGNRNQVKYRITGAFDFDAEIKDFPFDQQKLEIHTALEQSATNSKLQPPIKDLVDRDFDIRGWKILKADTGTIRSKNFDRLGANLQTQVTITERNIVQWTLQRQNIIPALRSFIPLFVLIFLSWYSSFYNVDDAKSAVTLNTTVFLAGVALYFSADKPRGAQFTFIDRLFIYFYIAIGTFIISEFSVLLGEKWYQLAHLAWSIAIPILLSGVIISLIRNILKTK